MPHTIGTGRRGQIGRTTQIGGRASPVCACPVTPAGTAGPPGLARSASPLAYIDSKDPPFLIQHGAADVTVSLKQSQRLYAALHSAGVPVELVVYPNVAHGFARVPEGGPDDAVNQQALERVFDFLHHYFPSR